MVVGGLALALAACAGTQSSGGHPGTGPSGASTTTAPTRPAPATAPVTGTGIRVGPGPQAEYAVEPQPPPGSCRYGASGGYALPDPHCTPGATNPQVTQATIGATICRSGYTSGIRPPERVTGPEKDASAIAYGYDGSLHTAEYDHLIPLELGGDPNDPANLWVEPNDRPGATSTTNTKDSLENRLRSLVCSGRVTLDEARQAIATDWVAAYQRYVG